MDTETKRLDRINELCKKDKEEGLTELEKQEQSKLRKEYIGLFKKNLKSQLDCIEIVD